MEALWKQALATFKLCPNHVTPPKDSFDKLKALADRISATDLKLDKSLLLPYGGNVDDAPVRLREPPVTYIEIFEDTNFTMGVFILKPGAKIPLHDHPNMHGILKVIAGKVQIQCYNLEQKTDGSAESVHFAEKLPTVVVGEDDGACVLTPESQNLHEIESIDGAAAFLDILAPPYESKFIEGDNQCHYYEELPLSEEVTQENTPSTMLTQVPSPPDFWSNTAPYLGPPLRLSLLQKLINFNAWTGQRIAK